MNQAQIDCQQLRIKHILYKSKVRSVLYGGNYEEAFFSSASPVSAWFSTVAFQRYQGITEVQQLNSLHREMSQLVNQLISLYQSGKIEQAHEGFKAVENKSEEFLNLLTRLEAKVTTLKVL